MTSSNISVDDITIGHVTIRSGNSFATVRAKLKTLLPRLDEGFLPLLREGLIDQARQELEAAAPLSIFGERDHGAILAIAGSPRRAIQYDIGNPHTASLMTRHKISAGLYAPIRVLLRKAPRAKLPSSMIGRLRPSDSSAMTVSILLLASSTTICAMSC